MKNKTPKQKTAPAGVGIVLAALEKKSKPLIKLLENNKVSNQSEYDKAATTLKALKALGAEAEIKKRSILDPLNTAASATRELFKPFEMKLAEMESATKLNMLALQERLDEQRAEVMEDFENGKIKKVSTYMGKVGAIGSVSSAAAQTRKNKKMFIVNLSQIPREYMVPDERKITDALKTGKKVAGCELREVKSIAV